MPFVPALGGGVADGGPEFSLAADTEHAMAYIASASVSVETGRAYISLGTGFGNGTIKLYIYSNNAGIPDALLGSSDEVLVLEGAGLSWVEFPFSSTVPIVSGTTYFLALHSDNPVFAFNKASIGTGIMFFDGQAYSGGPSNPFSNDANAVEPIMLLQAGTGTGGSTPPANDDFANSITISGASGTVAGDIGGAGNQVGAGEPDPSFSGTFGSVWYDWTAPFDGEFYCALDVGANAIAIYEGSTLAGLTLSDATGIYKPPASAGDVSSFYDYSAAAQHPVVSGTTYRIQIMAIPHVLDFAAPFNFRWHLHPVPDNDQIAGALPMTPTAGGSNSVPDLFGATSFQLGDPDPFSPKTVWYSYTAVADGLVTLRCFDDHSDGRSRNQCALGVYQNNTFGVVTCPWFPEVEHTMRYLGAGLHGSQEAYATAEDFFAGNIQVGVMLQTALDMTVGYGFPVKDFPGYWVRAIGNVIGINKNVDDGSGSMQTYAMDYVSMGITSRSVIGARAIVELDGSVTVTAWVDGVQVLSANDDGNLTFVLPGDGGPQYVSGYPGIGLYHNAMLAHFGGGPAMASGDPFPGTPLFASDLALSEGIGPLSDTGGWDTDWDGELVVTSLKTITYSESINDIPGQTSAGTDLIWQIDFVVVSGQTYYVEIGNDDSFTYVDLPKRIEWEFTNPSVWADWNTVTLPQSPVPGVATAGDPGAGGISETLMMSEFGGGILPTVPNGQGGRWAPSRFNEDGFGQLTITDDGLKLWFEEGVDDAAGGYVAAEYYTTDDSLTWATLFAPENMEVLFGFIFDGVDLNAMSKHDDLSYLVSAGFGTLGLWMEAYEQGMYVEARSLPPSSFFGTWYRSIAQGWKYRMKFTYEPTPIDPGDGITQGRWRWYVTKDAGANWELWGENYAAPADFPSAYSSHFGLALGGDGGDGGGPNFVSLIWEGWIPAVVPSFHVASSY